MNHIKGQSQRENFTKELHENDHSWSFSYNSYVKFHGKQKLGART